MENQAPYHVTGSVLPLPPVSEEILRADLLARLSRRLLREQYPPLGQRGGSLDWRIGAMQAGEQVRALRSGRTPLQSFQPTATTAA